MLSTADAQTIAAEFRSRFANPDDYATSVTRYLERVAVPVRSADGLRRWLFEDLDQHGVRAALLLVPAAARPELIAQDLDEIVDDCSACRGKRWVTRDLLPGHAEFGQLLRCPACGGRATHADVGSSSPEPVNHCSKCGGLESEQALERCSYPKWHWPNWESGEYPHERPIPGWTTPGEQLARRAEPAA